MIKKIDERYDLKRTASQIVKVFELVSIRYTNLKDEFSNHIDRMAGLLEQLKIMGNEIANCLPIGNLVASIEVPQLQTVTGVFQTLTETDIK